MCTCAVLGMRVSSLHSATVTVLTVDHKRRIVAVDVPVPHMRVKQPCTIAYFLGSKVMFAAPFGATRAYTVFPVLVNK